MEYSLKKVYWGNKGAGIIVHSGNKILLGLRSPWVNEPNTWSFPGGAIDENEEPKEGALREFYEETGYNGPIENIKLLNVFNDKAENFSYYTFVGEIPKEFDIKTDWETEKTGWFSIDNLPKPLHFGMKNILPKLKRYLNK